MISSENRLPLFRIMLVAAAFTHISRVGPPACPEAPEKRDSRSNCRIRRENFLLFRLTLAARQLSHQGARSDLPMDETSDEVLIAKIAKGDRLAMAALFARYRVRVFRFVARMMRNDAVAEELNSDVFLEIWRQAGTFESRSAVS